MFVHEVSGKKVYPIGLANTHTFSPGCVYMYKHMSTAWLSWNEDSGEFNQVTSWCTWFSMKTCCWSSSCHSTSFTNHGSQFCNLPKVITATALQESVVGFKMYKFKVRLSPLVTWSRVSLDTVDLLNLDAADPLVIHSLRSLRFSRSAGHKVFLRQESLDSADWYANWNLRSVAEMQQIRWFSTPSGA